MKLKAWLVAISLMTSPWINAQQTWNYTCNPNSADWEGANEMCRMILECQQNEWKTYDNCKIDAVEKKINRILNNHNKGQCPIDEKYLIS